MKNSDNKLNKEKQMSRLDHRQETSWREKGGREAMRDKKKSDMPRDVKKKEEDERAEDCTQRRRFKIPAENQNSSCI